MSKSTIIISVLAVVLVGGMVAFSFSGNDDDQNQNDTATSSSESSSTSSNIANNSSSSITNSANSSNSTDIASNSAGTYETYSANKLEAGKTNVLFFAASWCPSCQSLDKELKSTSNDIPEDLNILQVDYDDNRDLRSKYEVRIQHTLVQVDQNGEKINSWTGSRDLEDILSEIS